MIQDWQLLYQRRDDTGLVAAVTEIQAGIV